MNCSCFGRAFLFSVAISLSKVGFVCHCVNCINDDKALEDDTIKWG